MQKQPISSDGHLEIGQISVLLIALSTVNRQFRVSVFPFP